MPDRLLPPNASPLEVSVESVAASRIDTLPVPVSTIWNPDTCPAALLPWLAWALSVDEWNSEWTEEQKRRAIKNSPFIHKHKGTLAAVKRALSSLNIHFTIIEWFQRIPATNPFTFDVEAIASPDQLGTDAFRTIIRLINAAKNLRSHYTLRLESRVDGLICHGGSMASGHDAAVYPWQPDPLLHMHGTRGGVPCASAEIQIYFLSNTAPRLLALEASPCILKLEGVDALLTLEY